uniref:DNA-directed RNA polymerases I and III subunit RPAC1 n=1 Tax=Pseudodiaptomus poplesia TaxID=213370 RepID=A0A0U2LG90_9MAXI|nr:DNA-directed RNA polymerases I and III subunit RPAC1-like protein [Pseudodiaptomus poplesia]
MVNALRRILLSEVPSMATEKIHLYQNTSIMQDEVLAHRLGLVPLKADPRKFAWKAADATDKGTPQDTLQFNLHVKCSKKPNSMETDAPEDKYNNHHVYTKQMKWIPQGDQAKRLTEPGPVVGDILINKLRPGHEMEIEMFAVEGVGRDHAKFSPVATAFYRLMPAITLNRNVSGEQARRLQKCFSPGVIELEPTDNNDCRAVVRNPRLDTCSRNVLRYDDLKNSVTLEKIKDHFIFSVESVGALNPQDLVLMACDVMLQKCDHFLTELDTLSK